MWVQLAGVIREDGDMWTIEPSTKKEAKKEMVRDEAAGEWRLDVLMMK